MAIENNGEKKVNVTQEGGANNAFSGFETSRSDKKEKLKIFLTWFKNGEDNAAFEVERITTEHIKLQNKYVSKEEESKKELSDESKKYKDLKLKLEPYDDKDASGNVLTPGEEVLINEKKDYDNLRKKLKPYAKKDASGNVLTPGEEVLIKKAKAYKKLQEKLDPYAIKDAAGKTIMLGGDALINKANDYDKLQEKLDQYAKKDYSGKVITPGEAVLIYENNHFHKKLDERKQSPKAFIVTDLVVSILFIAIFAVLFFVRIFFADVAWVTGTIFQIIICVSSALAVVGTAMLVLYRREGGTTKKTRAAGFVSILLICIVNISIDYIIFTYISESSIISGWLLAATAIVIMFVTAFVSYKSIHDIDYLEWANVRVVCIVILVVVLSYIIGVMLTDVIKISQNDYDVYEGGYYYSYNENDGLTLLSYDGDTVELIISDEVNGYAVTEIGDNAFSNNSVIESVTIGSNIKSVGCSAFYNCVSLTCVTIGEGVTYIGDSAFENCYKLVEVYNLSALIIRQGSGNDGYVGYYAKNIYTAASGESHLLMQDNCLFVYDGGDNYYLVSYVGSDADLTLPELTTGGETISYSLYQYAFYNNSIVEQVFLPDSVTSIGEYAFYGCSSLTSVIMPDSVTNIGSAAFGGCAALESITLPFVGGSVDAAEASASTLFGYIFGTTEYTGATAVKQYYAGDYGIDYYIPSTLTTVTITGGELLYGAFYNCSQITSITADDGVTSIGEKVFYGCSSLISVIIPESVINIGSAAFGGCAALESITLPFVGGSADAAEASASTLFGYIFGTIEYTGATAVRQYYASDYGIDYYIPSTLTKVTIMEGDILYGAFYDCSSITNVTMGDGVTSIGRSAFSGCGSLANIVIPDSVTLIEPYAFYRCISLESINIPDGVTSIGEYAFYVCSSLTNIVIPGSVMSFGTYAFYDCSSFESINIPDGVTSIGEYAFYGCSSLISVIIPESVINIGSAAFGGCAALESITLPFVGGSVDATEASASTLFGYIFGTTSYTGGTYVRQYYGGYVGVTYYIPSMLTTVTITGGNILYGAFYNCLQITNVTIGDGVMSIGRSAFSGCTSLTNVNFEETVGWYVTQTSGATSGTDVVLDDVETNVTYLKSTYYNYYWYRTKIEQ